MVVVPAAFAVLTALISLSIPGGDCRKLIFAEEFNTLNQSRWQHLVTAWRGGNSEFQYYRNNRKNR